MDCWVERANITAGELFVILGIHKVTMKEYFSNCPTYDLYDCNSLISFMFGSNIVLVQDILVVWNSVLVLARSPRRSTGDKSGLCN